MESGNDLGLIPVLPTMEGHKVNLPRLRSCGPHLLRGQTRIRQVLADHTAVLCVRGDGQMDLRTRLRGGELNGVRQAPETVTVGELQFVLGEKAHADEHASRQHK